MRTIRTLCILISRSISSIITINETILPEVLAGEIVETGATVSSGKQSVIITHHILNLIKLRSVTISKTSVFLHYATEESQDIGLYEEYKRSNAEEYSTREYQMKLVTYRKIVGFQNIRYSKGFGYEQLRGQLQVVQKTFLRNWK